jgi:hypothetical protein
VATSTAHINRPDYVLTDLIKETGKAEYGLLEGLEMYKEYSEVNKETIDRTEKLMPEIINELFANIYYKPKISRSEIEAVLVAEKRSRDAEREY